MTTPSHGTSLSANESSWYHCAMIILGIESSCDETALSLIERGKNDRVLAERIKSQIPLHRSFGGVVPEIASRSHFEVIDLLLKEVLNESSLSLDQIDLIASTQGPGLIGSLLIGFMFGKTLAFSKAKPFIPVNHIDAHLDAAFIDNPPPEFPALGLVVSGGHTSLYSVTNRFDRILLAKTRDDAVGEVMDKVAKFFNLGYPGGPILDQLASQGEPGQYIFTVPKMSDGSMDFSFSGYKTAAMRIAETHGISCSHPEFVHFISSFTHALIDYLISQIDYFSTQVSPASILISGGVSRNTILRSKATEYFQKKNIPVFFPKPRYCTDNATMIAWRAYDLFQSFSDTDYYQYDSNPFSRSTKKTNRKQR